VQDPSERGVERHRRPVSGGRSGDRVGVGVRNLYKRGRRSSETWGPVPEQELHGVPPWAPIEETVPGTPANPEVCRPATSRLSELQCAGLLLTGRRHAADPRFRLPGARRAEHRGASIDLWPDEIKSDQPCHARLEFAPVTPIVYERSKLPPSTDTATLEVPDDESWILAGYYSFKARQLVSEGNAGNLGQEDGKYNRCPSWPPSPGARYLDRRSPRHRSGPCQPAKARDPLARDRSARSA